MAAAVQSAADADATNAPTEEANATDVAADSDAAAAESAATASSPRSQATIKKAAKRLRRALGAASDINALEKIETSTMFDLSSGVMDASLLPVLVAALKISGGAPHVKNLYLQSNPLLDAKICAALMTSPPTIQLPALARLHLNECKLGDAGAGMVANALCQRSWLIEELSMKECQLGDDAAVALAVAIRHGVPMLRELNLSSNEIADVGATALAGALFGTDELIAAPPKAVAAAAPEAAAPEGAPAAAEAAAAAPAAPAAATDGPPAPLLEAVHLSFNQISNDGLNAVQEQLDTSSTTSSALERCPKLRVFDVSEQRAALKDAPAGSGAAAVKQAADAAGAKVAAALANLTEEASTALELDESELKLGRSIASGAEAEVFRGLLWGQKVAVKQLKHVRDDGSEKDEATIATELLHETRILAKLSHPCVLSLIGYTPAPSAQIVLEVLDGTAYDLISAGVERCSGGMLGPLTDIASGCAYLHSLKILHRDLKPPNVLHDDRLRCKLCDMGTAVELGKLHSDSELPTEWVGSQLYVAPEVDEQKPYGLPADVFSFGVLAYELYHQAGSGVNYYGEGDMFEGGGLMEGLEYVRAPLLLDPPERPERPSECNPDAMWELLMRCVAFAPADRPTFGAVAKEIGEIRQAEAGGGLDGWL